MSNQAKLGSLHTRERSSWGSWMIRWMLPIGWCLATIGFLGPWVSHPTAALTLSGVDMGEFVKFLPPVLDGSLRIIRQFFYLPPFAVAASIALLFGTRGLHYGKGFRVLALLLALLVSLQILPPAWSPASLMSAEFRTQTVALGISWLLLATSWLARRLRLWLRSSLSAALCLVALLLPLWQYLTVKPAIDVVYSSRPGTGWGLLLCLAGLAVTATASVLLVLTTTPNQPETPST